MRGGGSGGGSGDGGGGGDAALLRRLRALLYGGDTDNGDDGGARPARGGRAGPARGGGGGGRPAGRAVGDRARPTVAAGGQQAGAADWTCGHCGFTPNFGRRRFCFDCGRARIGGASRAATRPPGQDGPVGAGGRKPILAWGAREAAGRTADGPPTRRTPGASAAALVEEARRNAARAAPANADKDTSANVSGRAPSSSMGATVTVDADGFTTVGRRGRPVAAAPAMAPATGEARGSGCGGAPAAAAVAAGGVEKRPVVTAAAEERKGAVAQAEQCGDHEAEEEDAPPPEPEVLRRRWAEEVAVVKHLARQGLPEGHPALAAAVAARDAAEAAWRGAKPPAPATTRLKWAQSKLARALELAEATRAAIAKAEADHERLMVQLHDRRSDDAERVRKRQRAVEDIQSEIGGGQPAARSGDGGAAAVLAACGSLCNAVGPELSALAERLPVGSEEWLAANKVLATLAESQRRVEEAAGLQDDGEHPEAFDIGDAEDDDCDAMSETSQWSESHELCGQGGAGGPATLGGQPPCQGNGADGVAATGNVSEGGEWNNWSQAQWHATHWQTDRHGRWRRASWADQWEAEYTPSTGWTAGQGSGTAQHTRRDCDGRDDEACEPSAKHRRQQASERTTEAEGTTVPATGDDAMAKTRAPSAAATAGTPPAGQDGSADYARQVANIVEKAISMGIQPITDDGDELITLSPELLSRWVAEHLETSDGH